MIRRESMFSDRGREESYAFDVPLPFGKESEQQKDTRLCLMAVKNGYMTHRSIGMYMGLSNNNPVRVMTALTELQRKGKIKKDSKGWVLA